MAEVSSLLSKSNLRLTLIWYHPPPFFGETRIIHKCSRGIRAVSSLSEYNLIPEDHLLKDLGHTEHKLTSTPEQLAPTEWKYKTELEIRRAVVKPLAGDLLLSLRYWHDAPNN
ncbi:hypothetical protein PIB30_001430 [Stylosanthes scabra]|uniref:Uncharacterized protein n=1 Tax=Stylosanthes scabra TaxID=79078 RepID=A0ABU6Z4V2_9FABA|nr:hypothetical protein [Stylosanthes scabra]